MLPYAKKYKEILSANKEININIIGLDDEEYEDILTREEFLNECNDEINMVYEPIKSILEKTNKKIQDIEQIEFIGGGHRIPIIKEKIKEYVPSNKIGVHLNGDDAVALGAGIYVSNLKGMINSVNGIQKKVDLQNYGYIFDIRIRIRNYDIVENEKLEENKKKQLNICEENYNKIAYDCIRPIYKNAAIIKAYNNFGVDKSVSFDYDGDLLIELSQNNRSIIQYNLKRIRSGILRELKSNNQHLVDNSSKAIKIKLVFKMDKFGLLKMTPEIIYKTKLFYVYLPPNDKNPKMVFKYVSEIKEKPIPLTKEQETELLNKLNDKQIYSESEKSKLTRIIKSGKVNNSTKETPNTKYFPLTNDEIVISFPLPMSENDIKKSKEILKEIWNIERKQLKFQEIKHSLEHFIYSKMEWANNVKLYEKYAREIEIKKFKEKLEELKLWFDKNEEKATERELKKKTTEVKDAFKIFAERQEREKKRENSIKFFRSEVSSATKQSKNWIKERPWITSYYNETLLPLLDELNIYINEVESKQNKLYEYEEPIFKKDEIMKKLEKLKETMSHLRKIPRPIIEKDNSNKKRKHRNFIQFCEYAFYRK